MDITELFSAPRPRSVTDQIAGAATATGTSFEYMLATAQAESGLNPKAAASTSSARGLYQIVDQTWLATMKRSGPGLGYEKYADAIVQNPSGRYEVADPAARREIMALRDDPSVNATIAGALTRYNEAALTSRLGRKPTGAELYVAHVLGPSGAARLMSAAGSNPTVTADTLMPAAAEANRSIFYDRQGKARSVADVYGVLVGRFSGARVADAGVRATTTIAAAAALAEAPVPTIAAAAPVGGGGTPLAMERRTTPTAPAPLFRGLFSDSGTDAPAGDSGTASPLFVEGMWASRPAAPASGAPTAPVAATPPGGARDLFQNQSTRASSLFGR